MTEEEIEYLKLAIEDNNNYRICVDNDCISISKWDLEAEEWDCIFAFNSFGNDFIVQLLTYIGCNANPA